MADQPQKQTSGVRVSDFWSLLEMLFFGLALFAFAAAVCTVLYEVWGLVTGQGWNHLFVGNALDWLLGMPPLRENANSFQLALGYLAMLPLDITVAVSGWLLSKISNGFEKLT
jgi:hypothetical protein